MIPDYEYERRIEGRLTGLRRVRLQDGDVEALVARVQPYDGRTMNVVIGSLEDLRQQGQSLRPGDRIRVDGYKREVDGQSTFVVQNVNFLGQQDTQQTQRQQRQRQDQRRAQQEQARRSRIEI